jgi:hypothetical protein
MANTSKGFDSAVQALSKLPRNYATPQAYSGKASNPIQVGRTLWANIEAVLLARHGHVTVDTHNALYSVLASHTSASAQNSLPAHCTWLRSNHNVPVTYDVTRKVATVPASYENENAKAWAMLPKAIANALTALNTSTAVAATSGTTKAAKVKRASNTRSKVQRPRNGRPMRIKADTGDELMPLPAEVDTGDVPVELIEAQAEASA